MANASSSERILFYGNLCLDSIYEVESYPKENTGQRALSVRKSLGGNGANSTRVLKQLRGSRTRVSWVGPVARRSDADVEYALAVLQKEGVDFDLLEEVDSGHGVPSSLILASKATGTRTIISTRNDVREMSVQHFESAVKRAFAEESEHGKPLWCHLECRQPPSVILQMAKGWLDKTSAGASLSLEVEKPAIKIEEVVPLLKLCGLVFFSQDVIETWQSELLADADEIDIAAVPAQKRQKVCAAEEKDDINGHLALRCLRNLRKRVGSIPSLWVCGWGETGAFALAADSGDGFFEKAHTQPKVVDSVGAGDTFIAACIHARLSGADCAGTLHIGCAVAGHKVGQFGFASLDAALPK